MYCASCFHEELERTWIREALLVGCFGAQHPSRATDIERARIDQCCTGKNDPAVTADKSMKVDSGSD